MKKTIKLFAAILFLSISSLIYSQTVSTIVSGPSTFDDALSLDQNGNIYASRYIGTSVTKITPSGQTSIFASGFGAPNGSDFGPDGYLYVPSNIAAGRVDKVSPAGAVEPFIASIPYPTTVLFRDDGKMYISSYQLNKVYLADSTGAYTDLYTGNGMNGPVGMRMDGNGNLLIADYTDGKIFSVSPSGVFSTIADLIAIVGFIEYANGYIYATGFNTNKIYKVSLSGQITVLAGTGSNGQTNGPAAEATFNGPNGIVASPGGDSLFISDFYSRSLRLITDVSTGIINTSSAVPDGFSVSQNYPNPFNPVTKIKFDIGSNLKGQRSDVKLIVFDGLGRVVQTLVNESLSPGSYEVDFDGSNHSSGIYYYTIQSGDFSKTMKMTLLK